MKLNLNAINILAESFDKIGYLPTNAKQYFSKMADDGFVFSKQLAVADSIHLHIKVADVDELPHTYIRRKGGEPQNAKEGYIKYAFADGYNFIFSSIPVSQEEKAGIASFQFPYLDHIGIDIRDESDKAYAIYNEIPTLAGLKEWTVVKQGGGGIKVYCCHVQVNEKYWVYPPGSIYWEFAFGNLIVSETVFGCDLRPANPALNLPHQNTQVCCGTEENNSNHTSEITATNAENSYYKPGDLKKFGSIGDFLVGSPS
jgi:hypothetical protein